MKGRDRNPAFFNNQKAKPSASLQSKFKAARAQGTLNLSSGMPPLTVIPLEIFDLEKFIEEGEKFWEFEPLKSMDLSFNKITAIPGEVCNLVDCVSMKFRDNAIQELPEGLFEGCISLKHLDLGMNKISSLSPRVCNLTYLKDLLMPNNLLTALPDALFESSSVVNLDLEHNKIRALPQHRWAMSSLVTLNVAHNSLTALPACLAEVLSLEVLNCGSNSIAQLPDLSRLVNLKYLDASQNALQEFPRLPRENSRNKLSHLLLGYNRIAFIDVDALVHHKSLSELLVHNNQLEEVPAEIEYIASLKIIDVANNNLRDLPPNLGYMANLQHIRAEGNPIRVIRQQILLKPVNELKAHLRSRGPSLLEAAPIQGAAELQRLAATAAQQQQQRQQHSPVAPPSSAGRVFAGGNPQAAPERKAPNSATLAAATAQLSDKVQFRVRDITGSALDMSGLGLQVLPPDFVEMVLSVPLGPTLVTLNLSGNSLAALPLELNDLMSVHVLVMSDNKLGRNTGALVTACDIPHVTSIDVSKNELSANLFEELLCPQAPAKLCNLTEIIANNNPLRILPSEIVNHPALRTIRLSYCQLSSLDNIDFTALPSLVTLDVSNNKISTVNATLFTARCLEYLSVENNELRDVPPELAALPRLKVLLIAGNPQRTVRTNVLQQGSSKVIEYLRSRLPAPAPALAACDAPATVPAAAPAPRPDVGAAGKYASSSAPPGPGPYDRRDRRDEGYINAPPAAALAPRRTAAAAGPSRHTSGFQSTDEPFDFGAEPHRNRTGTGAGGDICSNSGGNSAYAAVRADMARNADSSVFRPYDQPAAPDPRDARVGQVAYRQAPGQHQGYSGDRSAAPPSSRPPQMQAQASQYRDYPADRTSAYSAPGGASTSSRGDSRDAGRAGDAYSIPAPRYGRGATAQQAGGSSMGSLLNPSAGSDDTGARRGGAQQQSSMRRGYNYN